MEFLMNIASSVYFVFGASIVLIVCMIFIIVPMMNRMKQLDEIVQLKLRLLPASKFYETILDEFTLQREAAESALREFTNLKSSIKNFEVALDEAKNENIPQKISEIVEEKNSVIIHEFDELEKSLVKFTRRIRDDEKRSEVQLCNLVAAKIDFVDLSLSVLHELHDKEIISSVKESDLIRIKNNLQNGYDSVTKNGNYRSLGSNSRSGDFDRFIDEEY